MSFGEDYKSLRSKLHLNGVSGKALACIAAIAVCVVCLTAANLLGAFRTAELVVEPAAQGDGAVSEEASSGGEASSEEAAPVVVHVGGAVISPGVYELPSGSRVQDGVDAAGGFASDADVDSVNRARVLSDGEQVVIGRKAVEGAGSPDAAEPPAGDGKVNVNTADVEELDELKGVGPATAQAIVDYREENGPFSSAEDLLEVPGIGESKLEGMRDQVGL